MRAREALRKMTTHEKMKALRHVKKGRHLRSKDPKAREARNLGHS